MQTILLRISDKEWGTHSKRIVGPSPATQGKEIIDFYENLAG